MAQAGWQLQLVRSSAIKATGTYIWGLARLRPDMFDILFVKALLEGVRCTLICAKISERQKNE